MSEITENDVKRVWVEKDAICVELKDERIGKELIRDYEPLRNATREQLENCRIDLDGVWFDDLDEGLALSGFFAPKKMNPGFSTPPHSQRGTSFVSCSEAVGYFFPHLRQTKCPLPP